MAENPDAKWLKKTKKHLFDSQQKRDTKPKQQSRPAWQHIAR